MATVDVDIADLVDKKFSRVDVVKGSYGTPEAIKMYTDEGVYELGHTQDCCEHVYIEDIEVCSTHDLAGCLTGTPILRAEEVSNADGPQLEEWDESYTWTFYKLTTLKGYVDIRFYGTSNGYYSESADLTFTPIPVYEGDEE